MENNKKSYWFVTYIAEPKISFNFFLVGNNTNFLEFLIRRRVRSSFVEIESDVFLLERVKKYLKELYGNKKITVIDFKQVSAECFRKNSGNNP